MATLPQFMQQRMSRKTSDITRLASQYKGQVDAMTGEYEKSFADYTTKRNEIMAPYEAAANEYQQQFTGYEVALTGYKQRLADYQAKLQDVYDKPLEQLNVERRVVRGRGQQFLIDGNWMTSGQLGDDYTVEGTTVYKRRSAGTFNEKAPAAPTAPTAPTVEAFDTTQFDARRAELDSGLKREIGERKAAKTNAVNRKQARPLLQGA
jgi:hypothetical protein